ncbi:hypothetical protein [Leptolyngbya sp. 7M]|uniref:hypothetical protein n=1 Tax=Leptolyngbya sp. 7M TaxID=2812896 RepID=UPI001B8C4455|nr:hypothetical protein [Leptolyngbya sp. 7M]QYO64479.1 hypothetical protein JVX88_33185 [Leptolyngbya sp. 7M]
MMTTCIAATNRPREVLPNFIPSGQPIPLQPLPGANLDTTPVTPAPSQTTTPPSPVAPPATPPRSVPALW